MGTIPRVVLSTLLGLAAAIACGCADDVVPTTPPSCGGMSPTCGPKGGESCCASQAVPGGTYNRSNDPQYPATVSTFQLDRFEVTVGRFRAFVADYADSPPEEGAGAHPRIDGSGWRAEWNGDLPPDRARLLAAVKCGANIATWTDEPGPNEDLPINCVSWFEAFAFCAWDGGRLPTEAEWNYAAAGGSDQRKFPWGNDAADPDHAIYGCTGGMPLPGGACDSTKITTVGSDSPLGDGKWGQADLAGSMFEWTLDWYANPYPEARCDDCANLTDAQYRVPRGGSWLQGDGFLPSSNRIANGGVPASGDPDTGVRCARTP